MGTKTIEHWYRAYGLTFAMPFVCPELTPAPVETVGAADVTVRFGPTPEYLGAPMEEGVWYQAEPNRFLCRPPGVATYLVEEGRCITVTPTPGTPENDIRTYLLGICMSVLLPQRRMLSIHASAIQTRGGAALFAGTTGAGKSSTLAEFLRRGYVMLSDDVSGVVRDETGRTCVLPAFPQLKMWRRAAERLGLEFDEGRRVTVQEDKYGIAVGRFAEEAVPFAALYWLGLHGGERVEITPLAGMEKFGAFVGNVGGWRTMEAMTVFSPVFAIASAAANQVRVCRLMRPAQRDSLVELVDAVEDDLGRH